MRENTTFCITYASLFPTFLSSLCSATSSTELQSRTTNTFQNAPTWLVRRAPLGGAFSPKHPVIFEGSMNEQHAGLHQSVTTASVSALGKPSLAFPCLHTSAEIMTKKHSSSRQMKRRCRSESRLHSHFGITPVCTNNTYSDFSTQGESPPLTLASGISHGESQLSFTLPCGKQAGPRRAPS